MLKVLLPALFGDPDNQSQSRVAQALAAADEIYVTTLPGPLPPEDVLPDGNVSIALTEKFGTEFLRNQGAHVMVWGQVLPDEDMMRLRLFTNPDLSNGDTPIMLDEWLDLPLEISTNVGKALAAATAAAAANGIAEGGYSPISLAAELLPDMEALTEDPPENFPRSGLHTLLYFIFRMRRLIFFISDDNSDLAEAMGACSNLIEATSGEDSEALARACMQYGDLMLEFHDPDEEPEYLDAGVKTYGLARHIYGRDEQPEKWADATHKMGFMLGLIGRNRRAPGASEAAIEAFEEALSILTKGHAKQKWAEIIEAKSRVCMDLGRMNADVDWMWQSIRVLDSALAEVKRNEDPEEWASLTFRLGATLAHIGEETKTLEPNQRAIRVLKAALTAIDPESDRDGWSDVKNCLGIALQFVGEEFEDTGMLRNAIAAYTDALTVRTRDRHPKYWADTMNNMGNGYRRLGEVGGDAGAFEQAISAIEKALTVRTREAQPFEWASSMNNLALAHFSAGNQSGDTGRLKQAISIFHEALDQAEDNHPNLAHAIRSNIKFVEESLSSMRRR